MSRTHKKQAARHLSASLGIPYQKALAAINDALDSSYQRYPTSAKKSNSDQTFSVELQDWVDLTNRFLTIRSDYLDHEPSANPTLNELEEMAWKEHELEMYASEIEDHPAISELRSLHQLLDRTVDLAAQGEFRGFARRKGIVFNYYTEDAVWRALVRRGYAELRTPEADPSESWAGLSERGKKVCLMPDSDAWNESFELLFASVLW